MTHFSKSAVNARRKVFKVALSSLSVNTVSVPPVNVVQVTTTPTYQYTSSVSKHAIVYKPVFTTSHVNTYPAATVVTLNSSFLYVFVMYLCLQNYYVMFVKCLHLYFLLQISSSHLDLILSFKNVLIFTNN